MSGAGIGYPSVSSIVIPSSENTPSASGVTCVVSMVMPARPDAPRSPVDRGAVQSRALGGGLREVAVAQIATVERHRIERCADEVGVDE